MPIVQPFYFLIGKREKLSDIESSAANQNLFDQEAMWIAVNPQSGLASTAENVTITAPTSGNATAQDVHDARAFAQSAQAEGGK